MRISDWSSDVCSSDLDDGAGFLMLAQLELDGGADHRLLPLGWNGEAAHPDLPFVDRVVQHPLHCGAEGVGKALVRTQEEMHVMFQPEPAFLGDEADGRIGGNARSEERRVGKECGSTCRYRW